jgi:anti-anti-sigma factor
MQTSIHADTNRVVLKISGTLTFADNKDWRSTVLEFLSKDSSEHVLDMTALEDLDSAGLGMMLAMQKWAKDKSRTLKLDFDPDSGAGNMIRLSKFDAMFETLGK